MKFNVQYKMNEGNIKKRCFKKDMGFTATFGAFINSTSREHK